MYKNFKDKHGRSLEVRLRKIEKTRGYLLDRIKNCDLMSKKYKKKCKYLNYIKE